ncbi:hypothetical protein FNH05_12605 [Amycolatopsis rhizosphaerae]|uniref:Uncharacterized protein n=1 Tax=Amycolatopsis rhizosphaerae TaxID=2053003 RepID=A0A558CVJ9_9PSEU|nr:hypothetical protein [Amycolatopsis rhizosphaerae]TVT52790.1 hypothetical protein FNH05_12605 [Amycolatopsis rhizosphaerae]
MFRKLLPALREFLATQAELAERQDLLNRPWEEEFLHWAHDGERWHLHGHLAPPAGRPRRSTTRNGWCPGLAAQRQRQP